MTRFARAHGSKASNEKTPADSTPWAQMKEQLELAKKQSEEEKKRKEAESKRLENYNNFLQQKKVEKRKTTWFDFPENESVAKKTKQDKSLTAINKSQERKKEQKNKEKISDIASKVSIVDVGIQVKKKKNKKKNKDVKKDVSNTDTVVQQEQAQNTILESIQDETTSVLNNSNTEYLTKKQKKKKKLNVHKTDEPNISESNNGETNMKSHNFNNPKPNMKQGNAKKKLKNKFKNGVPMRRKPEDNSFNLIINGKEVVLTRYDGFPIMHKDAERLNELKKSMFEKGIPKSEVQRTMKLERRRAEKALARLKRDVCYNCRKGGHNLSDCPDLKTKIPEENEMADGVCFKCGSTEHRQFECKVQRKQEFTFASCFICKEKGHIARQCPDNPKGLYPNGGGCKLCGDVTHLRKDCPTVKDKKEESSYRLETLATSENLEDINTSVNVNIDQERPKMPKKIRF